MLPATTNIDNGRQQNGVVCAANESRFNAIYYSDTLTAFTQVWQEKSPLNSLLTFIAPTVPVARRFEFKKPAANGSFLTEVDDVRESGELFKRVEFAGESVYAKTINKGLTVRVDYDDAIGENWQERYVQMLLQRLYRNELRRAIVALDSADTDVACQWNEKSNPDLDIRTQLHAVRNQTGICPNRILFGENAWFLRAESYDSQQDIRSTRAASLSADELSEKLFVDEVRVVGSRHQAIDMSDNKLMGNELYLFYARDGVMKDEPSNLKRFVTPGDNGADCRVYVEEHPKFVDITVEHYSHLIVTSDTGIRKIRCS